VHSFRPPDGSRNVSWRRDIGEEFLGAESREESHELKIITGIFNGALYRGHRFRGGNSVTLIVRLPESCEETGGQGDRSSGASVGETSSVRRT
jgi:hypothetical protein